MRIVLRALLGAWLLLVPVSAWAQDLIVQRDVTVRVGPRSGSDWVDYVTPGTELALLDEGAQQNGYYHVRLADGREGWIYRSFVRRTAAVPALVTTATGEAVVHYIEVDQGAAALLEFPAPCGAVLIDAGGRDTAAGDHLVAYLEAFFARRTDLNGTLAAVFVTHTHIDHNRALRRVAETFHVRNYIHNGILTGSGRNGARWIVDYAGDFSPAIVVTPVTQTEIGARGMHNDRIDPFTPANCPGVDPRIRVLSASWDEHPGWNEGAFDNGNNHSLVIRVDYDRASFLFTGDLEDDAIDTLIERYKTNRLLDTQVYAVGHHGSYNGTTVELLEAIKPDIAVISMGQSSVQAKWTAWAYGHPRKTIVTMLDDAISRRRMTAKNVLVAPRTKRFETFAMRDAVYATGWDGDIRIRARPDGSLQVETSR